MTTDPDDLDDLTDSEYDDPSPRPAHPAPQRDRQAERRLYDQSRVTEDEIREFIKSLWGTP
jgi:hypothetical protein